eukprot:3022440-Pleurochrysis_carterae.AAC.1
MLARGSAGNVCCHHCPERSNGHAPLCNVFSAEHSRAPQHASGRCLSRQGVATARCLSPSRLSPRHFLRQGA